MDQDVIEDIISAIAIQGRFLESQEQAVRRYLEEHPEEVRRMQPYLECGNYASLLELVDIAQRLYL